MPLLSVVPLDLGQQTSSVKGQIINISDLWAGLCMRHIVIVTRPLRLYSHCICQAVFVTVAYKSSHRQMNGQGCILINFA